MTSTNDNGATVMFDGEVPRTITFKAREVISGGQFVVFSGTGNNPISSGTGTFASSDVEACVVIANGTVGSGVAQVNGIALDDVASGAYGTAATRGNYIVKCGGSVIEGMVLEVVNDHSVRTFTSGAQFPGGQKNMGRGITAGASGTSLYCLASLNF